MTARKQPTRVGNILADLESLAYPVGCCWTCGSAMGGHHFNARYCSVGCKSVAKRKAPVWRRDHVPEANARTARWHEANRDRELAKGRDYAYRRTIEKHGLSVERFNDMSADGCWICHRDQPGGQGRWHIDHDHACCPGSYSCGQCIRGILCNRCNVGLGMLGDRLENIQNALSYLAAHERWNRS